MNIRHWKIGIYFVLVLQVAQVFAAPARADELKPFEASYVWKWNGVTVAVSTLKLERRDDATWAYSSKSEPRGVVSMFRSERPTQLSIVRVVDAVVQPLSYNAEDGTSATKRDADIKFDWVQNHASGVYEDTPVDMPLKPGIQDDLSVQLAMFVQLLQGKTPANISLINKNSVREYRYTREGDATIATPMGPIATVIYRSEREGSRRVNRYWCAPAKGYLPMRVEQKKDDSVEWTMDIQSLKRD
jgi:hypothetical protein